MARDIGIDLGTSNTSIYVQGKGIVLREPSVIAVNKNSGMVLAYGTEAKKMLGRTPANVVAIKPLQEGVVADYDAVAMMIRHYIKAVSKEIGMFGKPNILISVPSGVTEVEQMAVYQAAKDAGAKSHPKLIEESIAAAIGADIPIDESSGFMIVNVGGGTTEIAVVSVGGIVSSRSIRIGGDEFDKAIMAFVKREYNLLIGERTAENVKIKIGAAYPKPQEEFMEIRGRDLVSGLPKNVKLSSSEIVEALKEPLATIISAIKATLEETPPELASDIYDQGIVLSGGSARLNGFDKIVRVETGMNVVCTEDPETTVITGIGHCIENPKVKAVLDSHRSQN